MAVTLLGCLAITPSALGAGRVELELATEARVPITAQQDWGRRLAQAGVRNVRIRSQRAGDQVGVDIRGDSESPVYAVTGVIRSTGELVLPGGRYRSTDAARVAQWLDELGRLGPAEGRPRKAAFGLTAPEFQELHEALAVPIGFSTLGMVRRQVVEKIASRVSLPVSLPRGLAYQFRDDDTVTEELRELSGGTALASVLRPLGMCLVPRRKAGVRSGPGAAGGPFECVITQAAPDLEMWPVGWEREKQRREIAPGLFEFLNVNVEGVPVTQVVEAVGSRLGLPVLYDQNAMARHGIEPGEALVHLPQRRTTYVLLLKRCLGQSRLKSELRLDERGTPFLWITTIKPI